MANTATETTEHKTVRFEVKATGNDGSTGEGIGNAFFQVDTYGDIMAPGAFVLDLPAFKESGFIGGINHDWSNPIGKPTDAKEVQEGLWLSWTLSDTAHGKDVKVLLKDGVIRKLSIGYKTLQSEYLESMEAVNAFWSGNNYAPTQRDTERAAKEMAWGGVRLLKRVELFEVSPVTRPANDGSVITGVKTDAWTVRDWERHLREVAGLSQPQAKALLSGGFDALKTETRDAGNGRGAVDLSAQIDAIVLQMEMDKARGLGLALS